ncbi:MAG: hypothetical protein GOVbin2066_42 [Prokaryotic dsDNA virus sp.]|nr:MAG: hypothetical protein GOVbin2066_42 [Prokaryotic dsDNA virus sp.]|tara:strand:+ start:2370 stop:2765 length:396 start_codon:yes stop_codon:yes gene_type:complete
MANRELEDQLINSFIENDISTWDPLGLDGEAAYHGASREDKEGYDMQAMQYFYEVQQNKMQDNDRYSGLEFDNFLKIYSPNESFIESFRADETPTSGPAVMWHDIYNRDTGLMKESALKGLRRMLASQMVK